MAKEFADFSPVDQVLHVGSPKGIARFMQRAGRSGHAPGRVSRVTLVPTNSLELLEDRLSLLGEKAGPILFQLPPNFQADAGRLASFLKLLSKKRRYSFEFRHPSWYAPRILKLLSEQNISLCLSDHHDAPAPWQRTADFVYVRGHGPGGRYKGHYRADTLADWAGRIKSWKKRGCDVFVYFDNDQKSAAPADARKLRQLVE